MAGEPRALRDGGGGTVDLRSVQYDTDPVTEALQALDSPYRNVWDRPDAVATPD